MGDYVSSCSFHRFGFFENTKEFSPADYEVAPLYSTYYAVLTSTSVELPGLGYAYFSREIPKDVVENVLKDFEAKHKPPVAKEPQKPLPAKNPDTLPADLFSKRPAQKPPATQKPQQFDPDKPWLMYQKPYDAAEEKAADRNWTFTVHKRINKLKLAGLIAGSLVVPALIIQGSISILAWIFRGFKG